MKDAAGVTNAPYDVLLDLQRALMDVALKHDDDMPAIAVVIMDLLDMELGRRNELRQALHKLSEMESEG